MRPKVRHVHRHGSSLVVAIPRDFRYALNIAAGSAVLWTLGPDRTMVLRNVTRQMEKLGKEA